MSNKADFIQIMIPLFNHLLLVFNSESEAINHYELGPEDVGLPEGTAAVVRTLVNGESENYGEIMMIMPEYDASTLAHESVHVANQMLDLRGIASGYENDELTAYCVGWLFKKITKEYRKKGRLNNA